MSEVNNLQRLVGNLKRVYSDKIEQIIPDQSVVTDLIRFVPDSMQPGDKLYVPVQLQMEQGITYAGPRAGAFTFEEAIAGSIEQAEVEPSQILGQTIVSYDTIARAAKATDRGAFRASMDIVMESLVFSLRKRQEINFLYGQEQLATQDGAAVGNTVTFDVADFASYHWAGMVGAKVAIYSSAGVFKKNATIEKVSLSTFSVTLDDATGTTDEDKYYFAGTVGNESLGIKKILSETNSLFGIDVDKYDLWRGNVFDAQGAGMTKSIIDQATHLLVDKGYSGDVTLLCSPRAWTQLNTELDARRRYEPATKEQKSGTSALSYYTQNGTVTVVSTPAVKNGDAFILDTNDWMRVGSVDVQLGGPANDDQIVRFLNHRAGYQIIGYSNQAMFAKRPANNVLITNIDVTATEE